MSGADRVLYDKDIREPLFFFLEETYGKIRILEEKRTGSARADVVMITPQFLYGIEIKSDADSYTRLKKQVKNYDWYYDRNIIVVGSTHAAHVREHVPDTWGIIPVELDEKGRVDFYVIREATDNPKVKDKRKITILWRTELNRLLERNKLLFDDLRKIVVYGIKFELLIPAPGDGFFQGFYGTAGPEYELVAVAAL